MVNIMVMVVMSLSAFCGSVRPSPLALSLMIAAVACTFGGSVSSRSSLWKDEDCVAAEPRARDSGAADSLLGIVSRPSAPEYDAQELAHNPEWIRGSGGPPEEGHHSSVCMVGRSIGKCGYLFSLCQIWSGSAEDMVSVV